MKRVGWIIDISGWAIDKIAKELSVLMPDYVHKIVKAKDLMKDRDLVDDCDVVVAYAFHFGLLKRKDNVICRVDSFRIFKNALTSVSRKHV